MNWETRFLCFASNSYLGNRYTDNSYTGRRFRCYDVDMTRAS